MSTLLHRANLNAAMLGLLISLKSILFKSNLENSSSHKNFLNWPNLRATSAQIFGPIEKIFVAR